MNNKRRQLVQEISEYVEKRNVFYLNDLVKVKTRPIHTPYVDRASEEFYALIMPPIELAGFDSKYSYRLMRLDKFHAEVILLPKVQIESINDEPLVQQKTEWKMKSSKGDKEYTIKFNNGNYTCNCPQFLFRKKECKHIKDIKVIKNG